MICRRCGAGIMAHESIGRACANRAACDRRKENNVKRIEAYNAIAARCGTELEAASPGWPPGIGGAITKHPLALDVADSMIAELIAAGAEAKRLRDDEPDRAFVYLAGISFDRGDQL